MNIIPFFLAMLSWLASFVLAAHLKESNWSNLVTLGMTDIFFFWLVSVSPIDYIKRRYMCVILSLSIVFMLIWALLTFIYTYGNYSIIDSIYLVMESNQQVVSLTLSILLIAVSISPKALLYGLDGMVWPNFAAGVFNYRGNKGNQNTKEGSQ